MAIHRKQVIKVYDKKAAIVPIMIAVDALACGNIQLLFASGSVEFVLIVILQLSTADGSSDMAQVITRRL